jgi:hypothetical protein
MNIFNIERAFKYNTEHGFSKTYFCIDLHDVVIEGKHNRLNVGASFFPGAVDVLRQLSFREDIVLILWTSSHGDALDGMKKKFQENGIEFRYTNENPECNSGHLCDFSQKFYFDILLDDKAGFEGAKDWSLVESELKRVGQWDIK